MGEMIGPAARIGPGGCPARARPGSPPPSVLIRVGHWAGPTDPPNSGRAQCLKWPGVFDDASKRRVMRLRRARARGRAGAGVGERKGEGEGAREERKQERKRERKREREQERAVKRRGRLVGRWIDRDRQ